jgi:hypothetical protein
MLASSFYYWNVKTVPELLIPITSPMPPTEMWVSAAPGILFIELVVEPFVRSTR